MPRPIRPWFRVYVETFTDRKVLRLTPAERWLWLAILGAARASSTPGALLVAEGEPMTDAELARFADVPPAVVRSGLSKMERLGMMANDDGLRTVTNWHARQFESDNVTERTRDHRTRSREQDRNVPRNGHPSPTTHPKERSNVVPGNIPDARVTETETETDNKPPSLRSAPPPGGRGTRLPEGWMPKPETVAKIREEVPTATSEQIKSQHERFSDHWRSSTGRNATKRDWDGAWRNWMREATDRGKLGAQIVNGFDHAAAMARAEVLDALDAAAREDTLL